VVFSVSEKPDDVYEPPSNRFTGKPFLGNVFVSIRAAAFGGGAGALFVSRSLDPYSGRRNPKKIVERIVSPKRDRRSVGAGLSEPSNVTINNSNDGAIFNNTRNGLTTNTNRVRFVDYSQFIRSRRYT